jgi:hypothetical protein
MRTALFSLAVLAATLTPGLAAADTAADQHAAIQLCRTQIASQAGVSADAVHLGQVRARLSHIRVDIELWRGSQLQNVVCDVARTGGQLTVASITPTIQTASAQ